MRKARLRNEKVHSASEKKLRIVLFVRKYSFFVMVRTLVLLDRIKVSDRDEAPIFQDSIGF